jgi:hypothetical protein
LQIGRLIWSDTYRNPHEGELEEALEKYESMLP